MILFSFSCESDIQEMGIISSRDRKLCKSPFHLLHVNMLIFGDISLMCYSLLRSGIWIWKRLTPRGHLVMLKGVLHMPLISAEKKANMLVKRRESRSRSSQYDCSSSVVLDDSNLDNSGSKLLRHYSYVIV